MKQDRNDIEGGSDSEQERVAGVSRAGKKDRKIRSADVASLSAKVIGGVSS